MRSGRSGGGDPTRIKGLADRRQVRRAAGVRALLGRAATLRPSLAYAVPAEVGYRLGTSHGVACWSSVEESMVLLGPPRSGKGYQVIIPMLLDAPGAVITTATRADNLSVTITARAKAGPVGVFDPQGLATGVPSVLRWSPVRGREHPQTAMIRASALCADAGDGTESGSFWRQQTTAAERCLLHAAALDGRSAADLYRWSLSLASARDAVPTAPAEPFDPTKTRHRRRGLAPRLPDDRNSPPGLDGPARLRRHPRVAHPPSPANRPDRVGAAPSRGREPPRPSPHRHRTEQRGAPSGLRAANTMTTLSNRHLEVGHMAIKTTWVLRRDVERGVATIVSTITTNEVAVLVENIRTAFESAWRHYSVGCRLLVTTYQSRAWEPLGLADRGAFADHTFDVEHLNIPKAERKAIIETLRGGGPSVWAIAAATGLGVGTAHRELAPAVPNGTHLLVELEVAITALSTQQMRRIREIEEIDVDSRVLPGAVAIIREIEEMYATWRRSEDGIAGLIKACDRRIAALEAPWARLAPWQQWPDGALTISHDAPRSSPRSRASSTSRRPRS